MAPVAEPGMSAIFANFNRNKRSVALDLKSAGGKAALRKLVATGDVYAGALAFVLRSGNVAP